MSTSSHFTKPEHGSVGKRQAGARTWRRSLLFALFVALISAWILSLPLFPTQDGPIHKYYVHVIASLLSGSTRYGAYLIRHPFPPYAIHYAVLLGLTKLLSFDLAEKVFVILIAICTAYSFRYCARALGPSGDAVSLCVVPLLLHWSLFMGFLNYSLAVGLFFLAAGLWCNAGAGRIRLWLPFCAVVIVLTVTHPVPLLLLIAFCALNLFVNVLQDRIRNGHLAFHTYRWQIFGLGIACVSFLYPLASADRARSVSNLHSFALHRDSLIASLALYGISPFDTRSKNLLIDLYRLGLYVILIGSVALAASGLRKRWKSRSLRPSDSMLIGAIAILVAIPILPPAMNGSDFFAQRLMIFVWLGGISAAAGYPGKRRIATMATAFAAVMIVINLLAAEFFIRPVADQLHALENQTLPQHSAGLALLDSSMLKAIRVEHQLGFDPYLWSGVLPFIHEDDVMLNSPWLDLTIMPLKAAPGILMVNQISSPEDAEHLINGNVDLPGLPSAIRSQLLDSTGLIVYVGTTPDIQKGLRPLIGASQAARYTCSGHGWYLVCTADQPAPVPAG